MITLTPFYNDPFIDASMMKIIVLAATLSTDWVVEYNNQDGALSTLRCGNEEAIKEFSWNSFFVDYVGVKYSPVKVEDEVYILYFDEHGNMSRWNRLFN